MLTYTPENPDRLLKYAIRVAKENDGEISVLRVITVPQQTPLSAGAAFVESSKRAFASLDQILDKEDVLNHYFVRVSHDATEAILATIEEQKIDLLVTDFETLRTNKKLQTLTTCSIMAIDTTGGGIDDTILSNTSTPTRPTTAAPASAINNENIEKKKLVVVYDEGDHSDLVLKTTSWLEHSGLFNVHVLLITNKETLLKQEEYLTARASQERKSRDDSDDNHNNKNKSVARGLEREEFLSNIGIEFDRVIMNEDSEKDAHQSANLVSAAINASQPDIVVTGANIGKFSIFDNPHYVQLVERLNCPVIIMRSFSIPGVNRVKSTLMRLVGR